jgi:hypothetical protein
MFVPAAVINPLGIIAALSAFLGIWLGHVAVRKIEFVSPTIWLPTLVFASLGIIFEIFSLVAENKMAQIALGIIGITLLWDALEFTRQQRRVRKGYAPANPQNPRHARLLADPAAGAGVRGPAGESAPAVPAGEINPPEVVAPATTGCSAAPSGASGR